MPAAKPPDLRKGHGAAKGVHQLDARGGVIDLDDPPELPGRPDCCPWEPSAVRAWELAWASPMAVEFIPADLPMLEVYADLVHQLALLDHHDDRHVERRVALVTKLTSVASIFGLGPANRWKLHWTIDHGDGARHGSARPSAPAPVAQPSKLRLA